MTTVIDRPGVPPVAPAEVPAARPVPRRVQLGGIDRELVGTLVGAAAAALALTWVAYEAVLPVEGALGFWLLAYAVFLGFVVALSATSLDRAGVVDRVVGVLVSTAGLLVVAALAGIIGFTVARGWHALVHVNFFRDTMAGVSPDAPLTEGGAWSAIVGTFEQVALSVLFSVPLGVATAVYLSEVGGGLARTVKSVVEAMSAVPTIVAGLFIYSMLIMSLGFERSGFAASLALSISMIPVVTMTSEMVLRLVPGGLREASLALGTTRWQTVWKVVLPTARPGLVTAVLLGVARVIGETSPVLLVSGTTSELNYDPLHNAQVSLPLFTFNQMRMPIDAAVTRAFGSSVVLLALVVLFFSLARIAAGRPPGRMSRRKQRRLSARFASESEHAA